MVRTRSSRGALYQDHFELPRRQRHRNRRTQMGAYYAHDRYSNRYQFIHNRFYRMDDTNKTHRLKDQYSPGTEQVSGYTRRSAKEPKKDTVFTHPSYEPWYLQHRRR